MLYLNLNSRLTITNPTTKNGIRLDHISSAEIKSSVRVIGDTATIVIPRAYYKFKEKSILEYFKVADKVVLELGYNGELFEEFTGYLREISSGYPIKLYCDDEWYPLRKNNFNKSWKAITLKELLTYVAEGFKIECPNVNLGAFQIDNASTLIVLRALQTQYGFYSYLKNGTLNCHFAYDSRGLGNKYTYNVQKNVKDANSLVYRRKEDLKIKIIAISNNADGKKEKVEVGSKEKESSQRTLNFRDKSKEELRVLAQKELDRLVFDGYSGNITGLGYPRVTAGDKLEIVNKRTPENNGTYLIEDVTVNYENAKYERVCSISYKI